MVFSPCQKVARAGGKYIPSLRKIAYRQNFWRKRKYCQLTGNTKLAPTYYASSAKPLQIHSKERIRINLSGVKHEKLTENDIEQK